MPGSSAPDWSVRDELHAKQTGFGEEETLATATYQALIEKARSSGNGGSFSLRRNGEIVSAAYVPGRVKAN